MEDMETGAKEGGMCPLCEAAGKVNRLKIYQINFDEAITFCEDDMVRKVRARNSCLQTRILRVEIQFCELKI